MLMDTWNVEKNVPSDSISIGEKIPLFKQLTGSENLFCTSVFNDSPSPYDKETDVKLAHENN